MMVNGMMVRISNRQWRALLGRELESGGKEGAGEIVERRGQPRLNTGICWLGRWMENAISMKNGLQ